MRLTNNILGLVAVIGLISLGAEGSAAALGNDSHSLSTDFGNAVVTSTSEADGSISTVIQARDEHVLGELRYNAQTGDYELQLPDVEGAQLDRAGMADAPTLQETNEMLYRSWAGIANFGDPDADPLAWTRCVIGACQCPVGCARLFFANACCCHCP